LGDRRRADACDDCAGQNDRTDRGNQLAASSTAKGTWLRHGWNLPPRRPIDLIKGHLMRH
jgi:hypothetical protein